ncbi:hypothetical protein M9Y10_004680 [Tritrichomonas musculus]|uniref:HNH nuclease domain-containing protein n=1 Tax=Tritrichomonas musculus TaxID=1915356 RepID=A0ABR2JJB0_9EUKA
MTEQINVENNVVEFVPLLDFENDYEILNQYPFTIRRIRDHYVISEFIDNGYSTVTINRQPYKNHLLIARQFIDNPDNLPFIDHLNHDRLDYHLSNLRWVSSSQNNFNKSSHRGVQYEFIDNLPKDSIKVLFYDTRTEHREFEDKKYYYYHNEENEEDIFYGRINETTYRILHINIIRNGSRAVSMRDINNKNVTVMINRFKYQHTVD